MFSELVRWLRATSSAVLAIALWSHFKQARLPKEPCLLSYDLGVRALPLLIERAAQVIEAIEPGRLSGELAFVATC